MMTHRTIPTVRLALLSSLTFFAAACGAGDLFVDGGGRSQFATGKADGYGYGACETAKALGFMNDPATSVEVLEGLGVRKRARHNLVEHRDGVDGISGTADDDLFDSLAELDEVSWVGPWTIGVIVDHASAGGCVSGAIGTVEVVFSPQPWQQSHLARVAEHIDSASDTIDVAMYSLRDGTVIQALEAAARRGVSIRLLFEGASEDRKDPAGTTSARLEDAGIDVRWINKIMHHKYAIFDGPRRDPALAGSARIVSGSGNWSYSAGTRYDENTVFIEGNPEMALRLQKEFDHLWNNSRDFVWNTELVTEFSDAVSESDIEEVDVEAVDAIFTSANFRTYESSRYGPTFSVIRGENEISDRLVELIDGAQQTILVASGHLRSRPVAEALLRKRQTDPSVEIRILLDGQEYISESTHERQQRELDTCLAEATTDTQTADCIDKGFYFSYETHLAGIPTRFKYYSYRWHYSYAIQMHHKYLIVDGRTLATGSYNLSDNAEHNTMENMLFFDGAAFPQLIADFVFNFERLWNLGRADGLYDELMADVTDGVGSVPIVFDPMTLDWEQVTGLKRAIRTACPAVDSAAYRSYPENHWYCQP